MAGEPKAVTMPLLFLKETPNAEEQEERRQFAEMISKGVGIVVPLSKQLLNPIENALTLLSLKELLQGAHKQLPAGSRLVVSVSGDESPEDMKELEVEPHVEHILLKKDADSPPISQRLLRNVDEMRAFLRDVHLSYSPMPPSSLADFNFRGRKIAEKLSLGSSNDVVQFFSFHPAFYFCKNISKFVDYKLNVIDNVLDVPSKSSTISEDNVAVVEVVYQSLVLLNDMTAHKKVYFSTGLQLKMAMKGNKNVRC